MDRKDTLLILQGVDKALGTIREQLKQYAQGKCTPDNLLGAVEVNVSKAASSLVELQQQAEDGHAREDKGSIGPNPECKSKSRNDLLEAIKYVLRTLDFIQKDLDQYNSGQRELINLITSIDTNVMDAERALSTVLVPMEDEERATRPIVHSVQVRECPHCGAKTTYDSATGRVEIERCPHFFKVSLIDAKGAVDLFPVHLSDLDHSLHLTGVGHTPDIAAKLLNLVLLRLEAEGIREELGREDEEERKHQLLLHSLMEQLRRGSSN